MPKLYELSLNNIDNQIINIRILQNPVVNNKKRKCQIDIKNISPIPKKPRTN